VVRRKKINIWNIILALFLLAGSTLIYLIFRSDNIIAYRFIDRLGLSPVFEQIRSAVISLHVPDIVKYSLPDGLWLLSYIILADTLLPYNKGKLFWIIALPANAIGSEIAQFFGILPGVFDMWDIICYGVPTIAYLLLRKSEPEETEYSILGIMIAPLLLASYLWFAGGSVEQLNIPFVITCGLFTSISTVIYILLVKTNIKVIK